MKTVQNNDLSALQKGKGKYRRGVGSESIVRKEVLPTCILESILHIWSNSGGTPRICCCVVARSWAGLAVLSHSAGGRGAQGACGSHKLRWDNASVFSQKCLQVRALCKTGF